MNVTRMLVAAIAGAAIAAPAAQAEPTYTHDTPGKTSVPMGLSQDLRSPDTRDVAEPRSDLTIGTPGATAVDSRSTRGTAPPAAPGESRDTDWPAIGAGVAVGAIAVSGIVAIRRPRRHRIAV